MNNVSENLKIFLLFQDIKEHLTVEMKGQFENDVFCADEIRIVIVS